jgi:hypothetical protein
VVKTGKKYAYVECPQCGETIGTLTKKDEAGAKIGCLSCREKKGKDLNKNQLKVLQKIYQGTDCCNEVYDYAMLHHTQEKIAETMPTLVILTYDCVKVDGDGFTKDPERRGKGYRLTNAGYEALTKYSSGEFPPDLKYRRYYKP